MDNRNRQAQVFQDLGLGSPHTGLVAYFGMVMTQQVQYTMNNQQLDFLFNGMLFGFGLGGRRGH